MVAAVHYLVVFRQSQKAVSFNSGLRHLRRDVAEQLSAVVNRAVLIAVKRQPRFVRINRRPRALSGNASAFQIKGNALLNIGQGKAVAENVDDNRRTASVRAATARAAAQFFVITAVVLQALLDKYIASGTDTTAILIDSPGRTAVVGRILKRDLPETDNSWVSVLDSALVSELANSGNKLFYVPLCHILLFDSGDDRSFLNILTAGRKNLRYLCRMNAQLHALLSYQLDNRYWLE